MERGEVVDESGVIVTARSPYQPYLQIYYYRSIEDERPIPFEESVLYQDDHIVVADKPHFLPVIPAGRYLRETLLARLKTRLGIDALVPVHRIDLGTAGLVVFSVREEERDAYQSLFRLGAVAKTYESVGAVNAKLEFPLTHSSRLVQDDHFMRMREAAGTPNSTTRIELLERRGEVARYRLSPLTGKKHQLRVHSAALGTGIVNDPMYPAMLPEPSGDERADYSKPLQLLACGLAFTDPMTGAARAFASSRALDW